MTRMLLGVAALGLAATAAPAQGLPGMGIYQGGAYPNPYGGVPTPAYPSPAQYAPNFYNRQNQPLSPYLNLMRGGNPAVNYFYGVRPGLPSGGQPVNGFSAAGGPTMLRSGFLPAATTPSEEPVDIPPEGALVSLPPSGSGAAVFGNRFGTLTGGYPGVGGRGTANGFSAQKPPQAATAPKSR